MSIRSWDNPGSWSTNYSALAVSNDNGENLAKNRRIEFTVRPQ